MSRRVRLGIDVGGTFTDAVALDDDTYDLLGVKKIPTTHAAPGGVSAGIVEVVERLLSECGIDPEEVIFIAHGTTQATNALLEGDVVPVGVFSFGGGAEGRKVRSDTDIGTIELAPGKTIETYHEHADAAASDVEFSKGICRLAEQGAQVVVGATAFSVDDPSGEERIMRLARAQGLLAAGTHEISKLYGLKMRTTTAVINASILPKMMATADMTERSVKRTGIPASLMVMRCDGGVMDIDEVRQRPILTMLSGPAAGVAGALMYEKVSNGIFLEVGGTSTDISCVKDGKVMVEYARIGRHKTYLNSLDVRTVGIAGGSMIRISSNLDGKGTLSLEDVGPRSAHIVGLPYSVFTAPEDVVDPELEFLRPSPGDPENYVAVACSNGKRFALTVACAANIYGAVQEQDYASGNAEAARRAFEPLARALDCSTEEAARQILEQASAKVEPVVHALVEQYGLDPQSAVLVGGGGGSAAVVPFLAQTMGLKHRNAHNPEVISAIGVALALVREVVERTIPHPTEDEILRVRAEAEEAAMRSGAAEGMIEVQVEVDTQRNVVRATATGATELRTRDLMAKELTDEELLSVAANSMKVAADSTKPAARVGRWTVFEANRVEKRFFGLLNRRRNSLCVLDREGVVRLQKTGATVRTTTVAEAVQQLAKEVDAQTSYGDAGSLVPECYLLYGEKLADLSGLTTREQILSLAELELKSAEGEAPAAILAFKRS